MKRWRSSKAITSTSTIVSANLPGNGAVLERIRKKTNEAHIPVMGLADDRGDTSPDAARKYDSYHFKSERQAILDAVSKLISGETDSVDPAMLAGNHADDVANHAMSADSHLN